MFVGLCGALNKFRVLTWEIKKVAADWFCMETGNVKVFQ